MTRVLIVDDDPVQLRLTSEIARKFGFIPVTAAGGEEALAILRAEPNLGAVILDLVMPDRDGMAVMEAMAREQISVPVIVQTAHSSLETVVSAMRQGAVDFFVKPVAPERLIVSLRNAIRLGELQAVVRTERSRRSSTLGMDDLLSTSPAMHRPLALIRKAAKTELAVLLEGETGTGKERAARIIHAASERRARPFIVLDCAQIAPRDPEPALFGADGRSGALADAHTGTLLLREIGHLPSDMQARLADILVSGIQPGLGSGRRQKCDVRLIATTSRRLLSLAQAGEIYPALYNLLNVMPIYLPPLRQRSEDIAPLARHFATQIAAEMGKAFGAFTPEALALLQTHDWPGNVRELENAVFRALALAESSDPGIADFPQILARQRGRAAALLSTEALPASAPVHIDDARFLIKRNQTAEAAADRFVGENGEVTPLEMLERDLIAFALARYGGQMSKVARALRIGRSTLYRKLREYGLEDRAERAA